MEYYIAGIITEGNDGTTKEENTFVLIYHAFFWHSM